MNKYLIGFLKLVVTIIYAMVIAVIVALTTKLTFFAGLLGAGVAFVLIGYLKLSNDGRTLPVSTIDLNSSTGSQNINTNMMMNINVDQKERDLDFERMNNQVERKAVMKDLLFRRSGIDWMIGAVIAILIGFSPYL
jgi:hypothetical protein